jgi:hypothetical protein
MVENNTLTLKSELIDCERRLISLEQRIGKSKTGPCEGPGWTKEARELDDELID